MRTRTQAAGGGAAQAPEAQATAGAGTRVPEPAGQPGCPECFQVGTHLDGCPYGEAAPPPQQHPATPPPAQQHYATGAQGAVPTAAAVAQPLMVPGSTFSVGTTQGPPTAEEQGPDVGQQVSATWGDELFQPVQFNGFRVGPFSASTLVRRGESVATATLRLYGEIEAAARVIRGRKADDYLRELARLANADAAKALR